MCKEPKQSLAFSYHLRNSILLSHSTPHLSILSSPHQWVYSGNAWRFAHLKAKIYECAYVRGRQAQGEHVGQLPWQLFHNPLRYGLGSLYTQDGSEVHTNWWIQSKCAMRKLWTWQSWKIEAGMSCPKSISAWASWPGNFQVDPWGCAIS